MATLWTPDTCGCHPPCQIEMDENGEPAVHLSICASHAQHGMDHRDVATECRTKERLRYEHAKTHGVEANDVDWEIHPDTRKLSVKIPNKEK